MLSDLASDNGLAWGEGGAVRPDDAKTAPQLGALEYRVIVECEDEAQQAELLARFEAEGLTCRALIS